MRRVRGGWVGEYSCFRRRRVVVVPLSAAAVWKMTDIGRCGYGTTLLASDVENRHQQQQLLVELLYVLADWLWLVEHSDETREKRFDEVDGRVVGD